MFKRAQQLRRSAAAHTGGEEHDENIPHVMPLKMYFAVFGSLLFFTVITVLVSLIGLPPVPAVIAAILVALVKATIVAAFFMHLIAEERFYTVILLATVFFMCLFFLLTLVDMDSRGFTNIEESDEYWKNYSHEKALEEAPAE